jgi:hypothetical protein
VRPPLLSGGGVAVVPVASQALISARMMVAAAGNPR